MSDELIDTGVSAYNTLGASIQPIKIHKGLPLRCYTCGPTVYADAHLGHARTYVSLDMIRRILTDYFRIPVMWAMNITDIDDKIINDFNSKKTGFDTVFEYSKNRENAFFRDMDSLNVRRPDSLLRVTEVIPNIITFVQDLIDKGFAYAANGSVYFDVIKYAKDDKFTYAELEPESFQLSDGKKSEELVDSGKRNAPDFALWKAAKPDEPSWDSPWGKGRPGWHIECSTMSTMLYGKQFDIHCGGIDLRFPHHTNEIAQSQARNEVVPWVHTWLHTGQLKRNGEKMAKSLKNYQTVYEIVQQFDWRIIRMAFALVPWQNVLDFNDDHLNQAQSIYKRFTNFLQKAEGLLQSGQVNDVHEFTEADKKFAALISEAQSKIRTAFATNFNVPAALLALQDLINAAFAEPQPNNSLFVSAARLVNQVLNVLGFTKDTLQLSEGAGVNLGPIASILADSRKETRQATLSLMKASRAVAQYLNVNTRQPRPQSNDNDNDNQPTEEQKRYDLAKQLDELNKQVLSCLDQLRDKTLPSVGIKLEDKPDGSVEFKIGDPEEFMKEAKLQAEQAGNKKKKQNQEQKDGNANNNKKPAAPVVHPAEMFRGQTDLYSQWDEQGIPTHDAEGKPLPKSKLNKLKGVYDKLLAKYNKQHKADPQ